MTRTRRGCWLTAAALSGALTGCSSGGVGIEGPGGPEEAGEVTLVSDDSRATVPPLCVEDIGGPDDVRRRTSEPGTGGARRDAQGNAPGAGRGGDGWLPRSGERRAAAGARRGVLNDASQQLRVPASVVAAPGQTVLTVEALFSRDHPKAVWQFLLADPAGAPS